MDRSGPFARMLARFEPRDDRERRHRDEMIALTSSGERAFDREAVDPGHFTASAFVLHPEGDRLLVVLHGKLGLWLQPGGHVEPSDADCAAAAARELYEECGIYARRLEDCPIDLDVHEIPAFGALPAHRHFDVRFAFAADGVDVRAGSDARAARWVQLDELDHMATDASVRRTARRLSTAAVCGARKGA